MRIAVAIAACLLLTAVPAAQGEDATSKLAMSVGVVAPNPLAYDGNATVPVTVTLGCIELLQNSANAAHTATVTVGNSSAPSWLVVTPASIVLDAAACAPSGTTVSGFVTGTGSVGLKVKPEAPGVDVQHVILKATLGATLNATGPADFNVSYRADHTITPSIQFPYKMTGKTLNFTVTVTQNANARSMVMFENVRASPGSVSGLASDNYDPPATKVFQVTYTAPETPWTEANITFHSYSHYLANGTGIAGSSQLAADTKWVITNGNPDAGTEASPLAIAPMLVVLVGAVAAARAKRSK